MSIVSSNAPVPPVCRRACGVGGDVDLVRQDRWVVSAGLRPAARL